MEATEASTPRIRGHFVPWVVDIHGDLVEGELAITTYGEVIGFFIVPRSPSPTVAGQEHPDYTPRQLGRLLAGPRGDAALWERFVREEIHYLIWMGRKGLP